MLSIYINILSMFKELIKKYIASLQDYTNSDYDKRFLSFLSFHINYVLIDNQKTVLTTYKNYYHHIAILYDDNYYCWTINMNLFNIESFIYNLQNFTINSVYKKPFMFSDSSKMLVQNLKQDILPFYKSKDDYICKKNNITIVELLQLLNICYDVNIERRIIFAIGDYSCDDNVLYNDGYMNTYNYTNIDEITNIIKTI